MRPTPADIEDAARRLHAGELVAFPTETVYGLGANALDPAAVARIYEAKGRPATSPLIVHVTGIEMARSLTAAWPETAQTLAEHFWPGPLTLVLPKNDSVPDSVTAGLPNVGLRQPAHPVAQALLEAAQLPLAAPSANRFTQLSPTTAAHVREALGDRLSCILDGGPCTVGIESTVLSLVTDPPTLLRPGMITAAEIAAVLGGHVELQLPVSPEPGQAHAAPGQHLRHYSPRTPLRLVPFPPTAHGQDIIYLWHRQAPTTMDLADIHLPAEPAAYAQRLYDTLHQLDAEQHWAWIAVEQPPAGDPAWDAVRDRLTRAADQPESVPSARIAPNLLS